MPTMPPIALGTLAGKVALCKTDVIQGPAEIEAESIQEDDEFLDLDDFLSNDAYNDDEAEERNDLSCIASVLALAFSPDGHLLAIGDADGCVKFSHPFTGAIQSQFRCSEAPMCMAFSPQLEMVCVATLGDYVIFYEALSGKELQNMKRESTVLSISFSPKGQKAAIGERNGQVSIFNVANSIVELLPVRIQRCYPVNAIAFSPDGRQLLVGSAQEKPTLYDVADEKTKDARVVKEFRRCGEVTVVGFHPKGSQLAIGNNDGYVTMYDLGNDEPLKLEQRQGVWSLAFSPDGQELTVGDGRFSGGGSIAVYSISTGELLMQVRCRARVVALAYPRKVDVIRRLANPSIVIRSQASRLELPATFSRLNLA